MLSALATAVASIALSLFGAVGVFDAETHPFVSAEVGVAELSPRGENGGLAVPASSSGHSVTCTSSSVTPDPLIPGESANLIWEWPSNSVGDPGSVTVTRPCGTAVTVSGNSYTDTDTSCMIDGDSWFISGTQSYSTTECESGREASGCTVTSHTLRYSCTVPVSVAADPVVADLKVRKLGTTEWASGTLVINPGEHVELQWSSENATSCVGENFTTGGATGGEKLGESGVAEPPERESRTYRVTCTDGTISDSDAVRVYVGDPPGEPVIESVAQSCEIDKNDPLLVIRWTEATDADDYHLERCDDKDRDRGDRCYDDITDTTQLSYTDDNVDSGDTYWYRVQGHNHSVNIFGAYSNEVSVTALSCNDEEVPGPTNITNLTTYCEGPEDPDNQVFWSFVDNASWYGIYRCSGSTCTDFTKIDNSTPGFNDYIDPNVNGGDVYRYYITACNSSGCSTPSNIESITTENSCSAISAIEDPEIFANPTRVRRGDTTLIEWDLKGNTDCTIEGANNDTITPGSDTGSEESDPIFGETIYTLRCENNGEQRNSSTTVRILPIVQEF